MQKASWRHDHECGGPVCNGRVGSTMRRSKLWDGSEAAPVDPVAVRTAAALLRAMPPEAPIPEIDVEPDGSVVLDWTVAAMRRFSVSIGRSGRLAIAWLEGSDSGCSVAEFDGTIVPIEVLDGIRHICQG